MEAFLSFLNNKFDFTHFAGVDGESAELAIGIHKFPFSLELPDKLPPNHSDAFGGVNYRCVAILNQPFNANPVTESIFAIRAKEEFLDIDKVVGAEVK